MAIVGPIAPFSNPPIEPQYFQPWKFNITNITLGSTTTITLSIPSITNLNYVLGQQVRLLIPPPFGCRQLNGQTGFVIAIPASNQITIDVDSTGGDAYVASSFRTPAQCLAIGDINSGVISQTGRVILNTDIPGSFINISPN
jgi:hypothetical protein